MLALALCSGMASFAQDATPEAAAPAPLWKFSGVSGLNLSQTSLTNWAAGGGKLSRLEPLPQRFG